MGCSTWRHSRLLQKLILFICCALFLAPLQIAYGDSVLADPNHPSVPGEYLIKFKAKSAQSRSIAKSRIGVDTVKQSALTGVQLVRQSGSGIDNNYIKELLASGAIEYFEPNYIISIDAATPNDARYGELWGMNNTGQTGGTNDVDIDAPQAWDLTTGSDSIVVGIVDTGINYNHPDLAANAWRNLGEIAGNGLDDDGNGVIDDVHGFNATTGSGNPFDDHGHGSHCAGTIGGANPK